MSALPEILATLRGAGQSQTQIAFPALFVSMLVVILGYVLNISEV